MKKIWLAFLFICPVFTAHSQDMSLFQKKIFITGTDTMRYRILLPENYNPRKAYPLFLFLHGAGERGSDNEKQLVHGASLFLRDSIRKQYPAIVVFPQCSADSYWSNVGIQLDSATKTRNFIFDASGTPSSAMALLLKLYKKLKTDFKTDPKRQFIGGLSMGGMGTYELVNRLPNNFAAAVAICGGGDPNTASTLS